MIRAGRTCKLRVGELLQRLTTFFESTMLPGRGPPLTRVQNLLIVRGSLLAHNMGSGAKEMQRKADM
jgi:hypothetical protein